MKNSKLEIRSIDEDSIFCEVLIDGHVIQLSFFKVHNKTTNPYPPL